MAKFWLVTLYFTKGNDLAKKWLHAEAIIKARDLDTLLEWISERNVPSYAFVRVLWYHGVRSRVRISKSKFDFYKLLDAADDYQTSETKEPKRWNDVT